MLALGTRFVLAIVWVVAVMAALLEILLGVIWAGGGIGDNFNPPAPSVARLLSLAGVAICIFGVGLFTTLIWRMGRSLRARPDRGGVELTAKSLAGIAVMLVMMGAVADFVRGDGALIGIPILALLNAPTLVAVLVLIVWRGLIR